VKRNAVAETYCSNAARRQRSGHRTTSRYRKSKSVPLIHTNDTDQSDIEKSGHRSRNRIRHCAETNTSGWDMAEAQVEGLQECQNRRNWKTNNKVTGRRRLIRARQHMDHFDSSNFDGKEPNLTCFGAFGRWTAEITKGLRMLFHSGRKVVSCLCKGKEIAQWQHNRQRWLLCIRWLKQAKTGPWSQTM
jgi:hypothetical protein